MGTSSAIQDSSRWLSGSERRVTTAAADLIACFPTRAPLMRIVQKPVCSPSRPIENPKRGRASSSRPMFKDKIKTNGNNGISNATDMEEPTSPKVTCAGQIRIKPRARACKNWQSVMDEMERLHARERGRMRWLEPPRIKKEIMHFIAALREGDDDEEEENGDEEGWENEYYFNSRAAFSQWSIMMQRSSSNHRLEIKEVQKGRRKELEENDDAVPPKNALLLMRCRSAPAQRWQSPSYDEEQGNNNKDEGGEGEEESVVVARYAPDFYMLSSDIAKETWVRKSDFLNRSRNLKR
ncbi:unnamed protein product [Victoria cruziana]